MVASDGLWKLTCTRRVVEHTKFMKTGLEILTSIVTPPVHPSEVPTHPDWEKIEKQLGLTLPVDYRDFVQRYGSGLLANFIRVFNPFSSFEYLALIPSVHRISDIRRTLKSTEGDEEVPYIVYPDAPGLVPWGNDENGNTFYWLTSGAPDRWPTVVGEGRGRRWERFELPFTLFLAKTLTKEIECPIWPDDFPLIPDDHVFQPY